MRSAITRSRDAATALLQRCARLQESAERLLADMDFRFLFDAERQLFSIGYNVTEGRMDGSYYDMLASEARLASFVAIATGQVPADHWFKLSRSMTATDAGRALLSWSGSMFEYFMPLLVMTIAFTLAFATLVLAAMRNEILRRRVRRLRLEQASAAC